MTETVLGTDEPIYTTAQAARRLQLEVPTIRGAIRSGRLRAYLPAGRRHGYRIPESAIQDFLRASEAAQGPGTSDAT